MSGPGDPSPTHAGAGPLDSPESSLLDTDSSPPPADAAGLSYEQASARIEEIIRRLDSGEAGLRETLELVREGRGLIEYCAGELEAVGQGLEQLRLDDLVVRLQQDAVAASRASGEEGPA
jgi:exodeoxyribonuclease VII small subunit